MRVIDAILLFLIVLAITRAVFVCYKSRKKGGCGCSDCSSCGLCDKNKTP